MGETFRLRIYNPPTLVGVLSILILSRIQHLVQNPKSKIQPQNPKFGPLGASQEELLHNDPKSQNPQNPAQKVWILDFRGFAAAVLTKVPIETLYSLPVLAHHSVRRLCTAALLSQPSPGTWLSWIFLVVACIFRLASSSISWLH